jgi:hypothetical protein
MLRRSASWVSTPNTMHHQQAWPRTDPARTRRPAPGPPASAGARTGSGYAYRHAQPASNARLQAHPRRRNPGCDLIAEACTRQATRGPCSGRQTGGVSGASPDTPRKTSLEELSCMGDGATVWTVVALCLPERVIDARSYGAGGFARRPRYVGRREIGVYDGGSAVAAVKVTSANPPTVLSSNRVAYRTSTVAWFP